MKIKVETKYEPGDIAYYKAIGGIFKVKIIRIDISVSKNDAIGYRYVGSTYPLKDGHWDWFRDEDLYSTKKEADI